MLKFMGQDLALQNAHKKDKRTSKVGATMKIVYKNAHNKVDELQYPRFGTIVHTTHTTLCTQTMSMNFMNHIFVVCAQQ
jgi:hypothetical protein